MLELSLFFHQPSRQQDCTMNSIQNSEFIYISDDEDIEMEDNGNGK